MCEEHRKILDVVIELLQRTLESGKESAYTTAAICLLEGIYNE